MPFEIVDFADGQAAFFTTAALTTVVDYDDTILIRTFEGNLFKVGHLALYFDQSVQLNGAMFEYEQLDVPEPSAWLLATLASVGLMAFRQRVG
jgi:hypothetical protein